MNKVKEAEVGVGFDAYREEYVDMVHAGILDPAKVTRKMCIRDRYLYRRTGAAISGEIKSAAAGSD